MLVSKTYNCKFLLQWLIFIFFLHFQTRKIRSKIIKKMFFSVKIVTNRFYWYLTWTNKKLTIRQKFIYEEKKNELNKNWLEIKWIFVSLLPQVNILLPNRKRSTVYFFYLFIFSQLYIESETVSCISCAEENSRIISLCKHIWN